MSGFETIAKGFLWLTEPSPLIDTHDARQKARLVTGSILGLIVLTAPLFLLRYLVDANLVFLALNSGFVFGLFILYRLSRSIYYQFSAAALVVFIYASLTVGTLAAMDAPFVVAQFLALMSLTVLMVNILFGARWSLVFAAGNIGLGLVLIRIGAAGSGLFHLPADAAV